jgi:hypothetical protein
MNDPRSQGSGCLDAETLAAYIDGRLDAPSRAAVELHLADCDRCREVWVEADALASELDEGVPAPAPTPRPTPLSPPRPLTWRAWMGALAASVALILVPAAAGLWWPGLPARQGAGAPRPGPEHQALPGPLLEMREATPPPALPPLVTTAEGANTTVVARGVDAASRQRLEQLRVDLLAAVRNGRVAEGRFSIDQTWAPVREMGPDSSPGRVKLLAAVLTRELGEPTDASADVAWLHARALANIALRRVDSGIADLQRALRAGGGETETIRSDLAAALLQRWHATGNLADATAALSASEAALQTSPAMPAALFNRALSLEAVGRRESAKTAWADYLVADPSSAWADEVRQRLAKGR